MPGPSRRRLGPGSFITARLHISRNSHKTYFVWRYSNQVQSDLDLHSCRVRLHHLHTAPRGRHAPGYNVRVSLADQGAVDLAPKIGARARQLEGTLTQASDSMIVMSVCRVTARRGRGRHIQ